MLPVRDPYPTLSISTTVEQIKKYQLSQKGFDRYVQTRVCITKLFLRVAFIEGAEALCAIAKLPFAAVKLVFDNINLGRLSPSFSVGMVANHLKRSSQCATALVFDFPALLIDPTQAQARLGDYKPTDVKPTAFESLLKHTWAPEAITLTGVVVTAVVLHRLGFFAAPPNGDGGMTAPNPHLGQGTMPVEWPWAIPSTGIGILGLGVLLGNYHTRKSKNGASYFDAQTAPPPSQPPEHKDDGKFSSASSSSTTNGQNRIAEVPLYLRHLFNEEAWTIWDERKTDQKLTEQQTFGWDNNKWINLFQKVGINM